MIFRVGDGLVGLELFLDVQFLGDMFQLPCSPGSWGDILHSGHASNHYSPLPATGPCLICSVWAEPLGLL